MATALELLNGSDEGHIVIGSDRHITVPASLKRIAVQFDHDVETVTFDCPRYWDGLDMSKMAIYINYMRSDKYTDCYPAKNVKVDDSDSNLMHFDWTISRNVTEVSGPVSFLVCIKKTDEDGAEINHWNSELCQDISVSPGMETEEQFMETNYDLITELLLQIDTLAKVYIGGGEIPEGYQIQIDPNGDSFELPNTDMFANAFKGNASGEVICVDDVSPVQHDVKCLVHGKNLFDISVLEVAESGDIYNHISAVGENSVTITSPEGYDGNGYKSTGFKLADICPQIKSDKTYVLSAVSEAHNQSIYLQGPNISWAFGSSMTITPDMLTGVVVLYGYSSTHDGYGDCTISNIQIEEGTVATEYEPYIDPTSVTVTGCGKNLISYPYVDTTKNVNGITFTDNGDGSITINGTATAAAYFFLQNSAEYGGIINSILTDSANNGTYTASKRLYYNAVTKTLTVNINPGTTISNETIYPQVEVGLVATDYEPYTGAIYTPDADGTCSVKSVSPTMTLTTDTPGAIIEAEYNKESKKAVEEAVSGKADKPKNYELIETITLTEEVERIDINREPNGTPYNFTNMFVMCTCPPTDKTIETYFGYHIRGSSDGGYCVISGNSKTTGKGWGACDIVGGTAFYKTCANGISDYNARTITSTIPRANKGNIKLLYLCKANANSFLIGTTFEIWGVRA